VAGVASVGAYVGSPTYHALNKVKLGGAGGWDYLFVDSPMRRLYISRGTHVMVMDVDTGKLVGDIGDTPGVHGVAVSKNGRGFTSNGRDDTVTVFDRTTLKTITKIPVGKRPDAIMYDPISNRVFTFNAGTRDATAIDANTLKVVGSVPLDAKPETPVYDGHGNVYVALEDKNSVGEFDARTLKITRTVSLSPGEEPSGMSIDRKNGYLFPTCSNGQMPIVSTKAWKVVARPQIGQGPDAGGFDPKYGYAFSSNGQDGTITVVQEMPDGSFAVKQTVKTMVSARTMAMDEKTHRIFLACADVQPPATAGGRPRMVPDSFGVLVVVPHG